MPQSLPEYFLTLPHETTVEIFSKAIPAALGLSDFHKSPEQKPIPKGNADKYPEQKPMPKWIAHALFRSLVGEPLMEFLWEKDKEIREELQLERQENNKLRSEGDLNDDDADARASTQPAI